MIKTIGRASVACLLLSAVQAHAVPITFDFSAQVHSFGTLNGGVSVPAPFDDSSFIFNAPVSGSFTIETDTPAVPSSIFLNGTLTEVGSGYGNPVRQLGLSIGDQQFNFLASATPGDADAYESGIAVINLPVPSNDATTNYDSYNFYTDFGAGIFSGAYRNLSAQFSMVRSERDLSVITSSDMLENLVWSPNWTAFFTIYDAELPERNLQIVATVTSLTQTTSVPEPSTAALLALGLVLTVSGVRTRKAISTLRS